MQHSLVGLGLNVPVEALGACSVIIDNLYVYICMQTNSMNKSKSIKA